VSDNSPHKATIINPFQGNGIFQMIMIGVIMEEDIIMRNNKILKFEAITEHKQIIDRIIN